MLSVSLKQFYRSYGELSAAKKRLLEKLSAQEGIDLHEVAILPQPRTQADYPVSSAQARVFFFEQLHAASAVYNIPSIVRLQGRLDAGLLERALQRAMDRHEVFRLGFELRRGHIRQRVHAAAVIAVERCEVRAETEALRARRLQEVVFEHARKPFDLQRPPLLRALVIDLGENDHYVLFVIHHLIADGLSIRILVREVGRQYHWLGAGREDEQAEALPVQFVDYALWEHARAGAATRRASLDFWRSELGQSPPQLALPTDFARPAKRSYRGAMHRFELDAALLAEVRALARTEGVTVFVVLLTAYMLLLAAISGERNIPVAVPMGGRHRPELEQLIGFFGNTVFCRALLPPDLTLGEAILRVQRSVLAAHAHQDVPFEEVAGTFERTQARHDGSMYDAMFELLDFRAQAYDVLELGAEAWQLPESLDFDVDVHTQTAKCDLFLCCWESGDAMSCIVEYAADLFAPDTIAAWGRLYVGVLEAMRASAGSGAIAQLPAFTDASARACRAHDRLLGSFNFSAAAETPAER